MSQAVVAESRVIEMRQVVKTFLGVPALKGVNLVVQPGEIHGLVGRNGAGKSTLVSALMGLIPIDAGSIAVGGAHVSRMTSERAVSEGIALVPQQLRLYPALTVTENLFTTGVPTSRLGFVDWRRSHAEAAERLRRVGLDVSVRQPLESLSVGEQQMVAIARALLNRARVIILDEPSAALAAREVRTLFTFVRKLKADGVSFIYISHHLEEVFQLCDRVTVLRDGENVGTREVAELDVDGLIRMMGPAEVTVTARTAAPSAGLPVVLQARDLGIPGHFKDVSFELRRGETLGITGLEGSGKEQLVRALFGIESGLQGSLILNDKPAVPHSPADALRKGFAYLPRDRKRYGVVGVRSVAENLSLASLDQLTNRFGFIRRGEEKRRAEEAVSTLSIVTAGVGQEVRLLSGGNQQKVVFAKLLTTKPSVMLLEEPTQGVDVHTKAEIWGLIGALNEQGVSSILISEEIHELLAHCSSVLVMYRGRSTATFDLQTGVVTPEQVIAAVEGTTQ